MGVKIPVRIASIQQETPTIKSFRLDLGGRCFRFKPGQWVDCYAEIEGRLTVAGYSITSSPLNNETIDLAVKLEGDNPVTHFLHKRARVGDTLHVWVGGDFCYQREMGDSIVLVGGGIGLTPLMSVLRYVEDSTSDVEATLIYSARTPSELLFHSRLTEMETRNERIRCVFTVTRQADEPWSGRVGRIDADTLHQARIDLDALFFTCGPPTMIQDMVSLLEGLGVPESRIKHEQWW